jgi:sulfate permease, SulP family
VGRWAQNKHIGNLVAGLVCSLLSISYSLSYAALIFSGPLSEWLSYGIAITFLSVAVSAVVYALCSSIPFAIASPDTSTAALTATLVAGMAARLAQEGYSEILPVIVVGLALATAVTGAALYGLGVVRAGRAIRFVPFQVIGGFLGATGLLMMAGAVQVASSLTVSIENLAELAKLDVLAKLAAAASVALILHVVVGRWANAYVLPLTMAAALIVFHAALSISGTGLDAAQEAAWVFPRLDPAAPSPIWTSWGEMSSVPWTLLPWLAGDILAVIFVTTISLLLNATGVELATRREVDVDRELRALGLSNVVTAALGGIVSCLSVSRTTLAHASGATGRGAAFTVAAVSVGILVADPAFLSFVPKFALAGLLFFAGGRLVYRWLVESTRQLQPLDYLALLAIAVIIVQWGYVAGVVTGIVIGCATFALSASRVNTIKFSFNGSEYRSSLDRSPSEMSILAEHGHELQGISLQSYLFFGSTNTLHEHVKKVLAENPHCLFLLFDFRLVNGIDSSAVHSFIQIRDAARDAGARLVLVSLADDLRRMFRNSGVDDDETLICENLDQAMELCEAAIIRLYLPDNHQPLSGRSWLAEAVGGPAAAERLLTVCRRQIFDAGEEIARQGQPSNSMHFIFEGRIGIFVDVADGRSVRVRSLGRHTTIGEMGLVTGRPRSATIRAEEPSELYELSLETYELISRDDPALAQALQRFVIAALAERLSFANRMISALQR